MASAAYFDKTMDGPKTRAFLASVGATPKPSRSKPGKNVYAIDGGGEAMVEKSGVAYRVRLYKGKCPC